MFERLKEVEQQYRIDRLGIESLVRTGAAGPYPLRGVRRAIEEVEPTYVVRMFAEF